MVKPISTAGHKTLSKPPLCAVIQPPDWLSSATHSACPSSMCTCARRLWVVRFPRSPFVSHLCSDGSSHRQIHPSRPSLSQPKHLGHGSTDSSHPLQMRATYGTRQSSGRPRNKEQQGKPTVMNLKQTQRGKHRMTVLGSVREPTGCRGSLGSDSTPMTKPLDGHSGRPVHRTVALHQVARVQKHSTQASPSPHGFQDAQCQLHAGADRTLGSRGDFLLGTRHTVRQARSIWYGLGAPAHHWTASMPPANLHTMQSSPYSCFSSPLAFGSSQASLLLSRNPSLMPMVF